MRLYAREESSGWIRGVGQERGGPKGNGRMGMADYRGCSDEELIARLRVQDTLMPGSAPAKARVCGSKEETLKDTLMPGSAPAKARVCGSKEEILKDTLMPCGNKEEITDYILGKYKPLVRKRANALYLIGGDTDDLIQEGMIGLFKAIRDFSPDKDSSFYNFARICVERQMYTAIEASRRKKHAPLNSYISLYDDSDEEGMALADVLRGEEDENPEYLLIDRESVEQKLEALSGKLSKMEKQVFDYMLEGFSYRKIAEIMGKSPKAIDNAIQRMKGKAGTE